MARYSLPSKHPGIRNYMHQHAHEPFRVSFECESDVEPPRDYAQYLRDRVEKSVTPKRLRGGRVRAVVPMDVYVRSLRERWDDKKWEQWCRDPDNAALQVERNTSL